MMSLTRFLLTEVKTAVDPSSGALAVLSLIAAAIFIIVFFKRRGNIWRYLCKAAITVYLIFAISYAIFPIYFEGPSYRELFSEYGWTLRKCINPVPFEDGVIMDDFPSVVLTFPLGFLLTLVKKRFTWCHAALAGLIFPLDVELIQLLTAAMQGFSLHYVDTADVICSLAGTMLGYLVVFLAVQPIERYCAGDDEKTLFGYIASRTLK